MKARIIQVRFPKLHSWQRAVFDHPERYKVVACGRQSGKSTFAQVYLGFYAMKGEPVSYMAPTSKMASQTWREMKQLIAPLVGDKNENERRLELYGGGSLEFWSLDNPDSPRGRRYKRVVIDEAAFLPDDYAWQAVVQPTLIALNGSAVFCSTPFGMNWFYRIWLLGDPNNRNRDPEWWSIRYPTSSNPIIKPSEIESKKRLLPERIFSQEYLADFISDAGVIFRNLDKCAVAHPQEGAAEGHQYAIGCDFAKSEDFSVFAVVDMTTRELVCIERDHARDYTLQLGNLRALCHRFNPTVVIAEKTGVGDALVDQMRLWNIPIIPFVTTAVSKANLVQDLAFAFDAGPSQIRILNDPILLAELQAFEPSVLPSGLVRYAAPDGMHDDCVMALLFAWYAMSSGVGVEVGYMRIH